MVVAPEYNLWTQAIIPLVLAALHNFIQTYDDEDKVEMDGDYKALD